MAKQRKLEMDANEFLRNVTPAVKRSRLVPYWDDIAKLRASNCSLGQVCGYLRENGVQISIAGLSKYIKKREDNGKNEGISKNNIHTEIKANVRSNAESTKKQSAFADAPILDAPSDNPLKVLSGSRISGNFSPIPDAKIEFDQ